MKNRIKKALKKETVYYIESLIYIFSIIIVVTANVYGPIWIRMIPLLFILGVVGKLVFDRPVITTLFGTIVSVCVLYISGVNSIKDNVLTSIIYAIYIAFGEVFAIEIKKVYERYFVDKKRDLKKIIISLSISILVFLFCTLFHNYTQSNIFMYNNVKMRLKRYLLLNYSNQKFEFVDVKYDYKNEKCFKFNVIQKDTDNSYIFIVYVDKKLKIVDGIEENVIYQKVSQMNETLKDITKDEESKIKKSINQENEVYEIELSKEVEKINQDELLEFSKEVSVVINKVIDDGRLDNIEQVNISLIDESDKKESKIATIYMNGYISNKNQKLLKDYSYIMRALDIEYID